MGGDGEGSDFGWELWPRGLRKREAQATQVIQADVGPGLGVPSDFISVGG